MKECLICGSRNLETIDTRISDFVMSRITKNTDCAAGSGTETKLCFCKDCTFSFYEYRLSENESQLLYDNYRDDVYQKVRQRYECWYTEKVNNAINSDKKALSEQQNNIERVLSDNKIRDLDTGLDYGGNEGRTFTDRMGRKKKYVFDISGVQTVEGVENITRYEDLKRHSYDFIMCNHVLEHVSSPVDILHNLWELGGRDTVYYVEVPSENPFLKGDKFSVLKNLPLLWNPYVSRIQLFRHWMRQRRGPYMPMKEHINFFTEKSMRVFLESNAFSVIDIQENQERTAIGTTTVLSALFQKRAIPDHV